MAEDFDIEALLEAPYNRNVDKPATASIENSRDSTDLSQQATSIETSKSADREIFSEHEENAANEKCDEISNISSTASSSTRSSISSISAQYDNRERALCSTRSHRKFTYHNALAHVERTYYSPNYCPWYTDSSTGRENFDSTSDSIYSDSYESDSQSEDANNTDKSSPILVSSNGKKRENGKHRSRSRSRDREKDREKKRSERDKEKKSSRRSRSREKKRSKSKERKRSTSRSKDKKKSRSRSKDKKRSRSRSKDRKRSKSREKRARSKSRERHRERHDRDKERDNKERDNKERDNKERDNKERDKERDREKERRRERSRSKDAHRRRRSRSPEKRFRRGRTPPNSASRAYSRSDEEIDIEERDSRTIFCMQLSQRIRARDLEEFFSSVGKVRDVRLITCNKTKRFKGIAYIEFKNAESVPLALGLNGQKLLGIPISVQHTHAEKNRIVNQAPAQQQQPPPPKNHSGPMRLYVGSLHFNITEEMLRGIFEPFGKIDSIQLIMDSDTGRSKGYGFITFHHAEDAKKALEQLNGFELAGRPMKVGNVTERLDVNTTASLDTDEMDRSGIDLGATGRLQLMFKLAEGAGLAVPQAAANALLATAPQPQVQPQIAPPIATQCFLLSNMFDPLTETNPQWDTEIRDEVIEECQKHGGILHVYVDRASQGNVYVKCPSIATAVLAVNALHGRWFAGRTVTAAYVPLINYHALFPDAATAVNLLQPSSKA